jgi:hypothetical protein
MAKPITLEFVGEPFVMRYARDRFSSVSGEPDAAAHLRHLYCSIEKADVVIGVLRFIEWRVEAFVDNSTFVEDMDTLSQASYDLGNALVETFDMSWLSLYGNIIEFSLAWMEPSHARLSLWAVAAQRCLRSLFRRPGLLVLKAFPIEYEGNVTNPELRAALKDRQRAMFRHYRRLLSVEPLPSAAAEDGWMWRPLNRNLALEVAARIDAE